MVCQLVEFTNDDESGDCRHPEILPCWALSIKKSSFATVSARMLRASA